MVSVLARVQVDRVSPVARDYRMATTSPVSVAMVTCRAPVVTCRHIAVALPTWSGRTTQRNATTAAGRARNVCVSSTSPKMMRQMANSWTYRSKMAANRKHLKHLPATACHARAGVPEIRAFPVAPTSQTATISRVTAATPSSRASAVC